MKNITLNNIVDSGKCWILLETVQGLYKGYRVGGGKGDSRSSFYKKKIVQNDAVFISSIPNNKTKMGSYFKTKFCFLCVIPSFV